MGRISDGTTGSGGGRLFDAGGRINPGMEELVRGPNMPSPTPSVAPQAARTIGLVNDLTRPVATPASTDLLGKRATSPGSKSGSLPTPPPAGPVAPVGSVTDSLDRTLAGVGQRSMAARTPAAPAPAPSSFIDLVSKAAQSGIGTLVKDAKESKAAVKGIGMGVGTLAVNLLAGLNDPFNHYSTAGDNVEQKLRNDAAGKGRSQPNKPIDYTGDVLSDAATGLLGRFTVATKGIGALAAVPKVASKVVGGAALATFGLSVVKDTPQYVKQIIDAPDPTQKFSLATQLLGSYFLLGHGAKTVVGEIPTTKTIKGETTTVPLDFHAAVEFTSKPNPDLTPQQVKAFQDLYNQGGTAVKEAIKRGGVDVTSPDVTVPNVYGHLINVVAAKLGRQEPLNPAEIKVQAATVMNPETLVPRPETLVKDPAALAVIKEAPSVPAVPAQRTMSRISLPELGMEGTPQQAIVPAQVARTPHAPIGSSVRIDNLMSQAQQSPDVQAFLQQTAQINPAVLRGFPMSDGTVVNGPGTAPGTVSVADLKAKQLVDRPAQDVLTDFYQQARGEAVASKPNYEDLKGDAAVEQFSKDTGVQPDRPAHQKQIEDALARGDKPAAIAIVEKMADSDPYKPSMMSLLGMEQPKRSLKSRGAQPTTLESTPSVKFKAPDEALQALRTPTEVAKYLHSVRGGDRAFEFTSKPLPDGAAAFFDPNNKGITAALDSNSKVDINHVAHEVGHEVFDLLAPAERAELAVLVREQYKGTPGELAAKIVGYNYLDAPMELQGVLDTAIKDVRQGEPSLFQGDPSKPGYSSMRDTYEQYLRAIKKTSQAEIDAVIKQNSTSGRALVKFLHEVKDQSEQKSYSDTVMEEIFADMNAEYRAKREDLSKLGWSDQLKAWFGRLWEDLKQAIGGSYDKLDDVFRKSYEGQFKEQLRDTNVPELALARAKLPDNKAPVIYHATPEKFTEFDVNRMEGGAAWFTNSRGEIDNNTVGAVAPAGKTLNVMERQIKPGVKLADEVLDDRLTTDQLIADGYRGVVYEGENGVQWTKLFFPNEDTIVPGAKLKLSEDDELWRARFRDEWGVKDVADTPPPALGEVKIGETRQLFDPESTPGQDHAIIAAANKPESAKNIVENYDGLLELRRLKAEHKIKEIFKDVPKEKDKELFEAAKAYQETGADGAQSVLDPELFKVFNQVTHLYDSVGQDAFVSGRIRGIRENYITQVWEQADLPDTSLTPEQINFLRGASSMTTRFSLERIVKNYNLGISVGLKPKYDRLSDLVRVYLAADAKAAAGRFLSEDLQALGTEHVDIAGGSLPAGWRAINKISGLRGYAVSPDVYRAIRNIESVSGVRATKAGRALVKTAQTSTQIIMAGDLLLLKNYFFDAPKASFLGAFRLAYEGSHVDPETQAKLVALGGLKLSEHTPEMEGSKMGKVLSKVLNEKKNPYFWADWASFKGGDVLRKGTAAMIYKGMVKKGVDEATAAKEAVRFAQDAFGRQNLVRAGRSQTVQDILRIGMISPDYTESRFKFIGKAIAGATFKIGSREHRRYAAGFIRYLFYAGLLLETLNLATSGHTSDKNDEDHKFDLEVKKPDGTHYYVNVIGVVKTDLRLLQGMADAVKGDPTTVVRFIGNKGSSLERVAQMLITGKDYQGNDITNKFTDTPTEKLQKLGLNAVNNFIPLPFQEAHSNTPDTPAPKGVEGFVFRTLGLDLYNPKSVPTQARQSLTELETTKQNTQLQVYSLIRAGKEAEAQKLIEAFNKKAGTVGTELSKLNNISETDKKSLQELGTSAAVNPGKLINKAKASAAAGPSDNPISKIIDYGVGGVTISNSKSTTGKANAKASAKKAAATRRMRSGGAKKIRISKTGKVLGVKTLRTPKAKKISVGKRLSSGKVRVARTFKTRRTG